VAMSLGALLQQIAVMTKNALVKTSGIIGDDLALNSKQLIGAPREREIPMIKTIAKGSLRNKAIIIPAALGLSAAVPAAIMPLLTVGGAYLCYDGVEKILHKIKGHDKHAAKADEGKDPATLEKETVKEAIKIDFILSAEIIAVSLWTVAAAPFLVQAGALAAVGLAMSVGVYGLVAGFIRMDDAGHALAKKEGKGLHRKAQRALGKALLKTSSPLIKTLGVVGTVAMFLVGGGMVMHGVGLEHVLHDALHHVPGALGFAAESLAATGAGVVAGIAALPVMKFGIQPAARRAAKLGRKAAAKVKKKKAPEAKAAKAKPHAPEASKDALRQTGAKDELNKAAQKPEGKKPAAKTPAAKPGKPSL
jgi:predicted DNA repair protein MutK